MYSNLTSGDNRKSSRVLPRRFSSHIQVLLTFYFYPDSSLPLVAYCQCPTCYWKSWMHSVQQIISSHGVISSTANPSCWNRDTAWRVVWKFTLKLFLLQNIFIIATDDVLQECWHLKISVDGIALANRLSLHLADRSFYRVSESWWLCGKLREIRIA